MADDKRTFTPVEISTALKKCHYSRDCVGCPLQGAQSQYCSDLEDNAADLIVKLAKQVEELEEAARWIPVTERLPEKEGRYLCVVRIGYRSGAVYVQIMNGDSHGFSLEHIYNDDVTHWKPLPKGVEVSTDAQM